MEPFLQYMAGGPCYECGGKTKYAGGGQKAKASAQAQQGEQAGPDEQAQQLMMFLTEQISKGTSPSVLKRTLTQSGVKSEEADQLVQIATQLFEQQFQQGMEPVKQEPMQQQPYMQENPFGPSQEQEQQMMKYGGLRKFIEGGFDPGPKVYNAEGTSYTQKAIDPEYEKKLTDNTNITVTDKNQISNIADTKFNRGLAYMSGLSNPNSAIANLPDAGGFGAGLKFLAGAAGFLGSAGLGIKKFTADDRTRMYDSTGNILTDSQNPDKYVKTIDKTVAMTPEEIAQRKAEQSLETAKTEGANAEAEAEKVKSEAMNQFDSANNFIPNAANTIYPKISPIVNNTGPINYQEPEAGGSEKLNYMDSSLTVPEKEEGGEWNPFVDNRRKLKFTMPLYIGGGPFDNETSPYTQQEWAIKQSKSFPLSPDDAKLYDEYVGNFNVKNDLTEKQPTKPIVKRGDPLGKVVANNALNGMQMMAGATDYFVNQKKQDALNRKRIMSGNTMEAAPVVNPVNPYGSMYTLNAGPGANQNVAQLGYTFDFGTTMATAKYGGMTEYKKGGVYQVSPEELQRIIDMGGEVEFLD